MFGKRLINTGVALCPSSEFDIFGDSSGVALYQLNSNADDSSGNYDGTATDVTYVSGHIDNAGSFNGSSSNVTTISSVDWNSFGDNYSFSFWAKITRGRFNPFVFSASSLNTGYFTMFVASNSNDSVSFGIYSTYPQGTENIITTSANTINEDRYYHIVASSNNSQIKLYIDGSLVGTTTKTISRGDSNNLYLGGLIQYTAPQYMQGDLDQVRILNKAISAAEVTTLYNEVAC
jgi:hypothetical protein